MDPLQTITSRIAHPTATAFSALPDAPVVSEPRRAVAAGSRRRVADVLHRLGDAIAPTPTPAPAGARGSAAVGPREAYAGGQ